MSGNNSNRRCIVVGPKTWKRLHDLKDTEEKSISELIRESLDLLFQNRANRKEYDPIQDS